MMYSSGNNLWTVVKKQAAYKFQSNARIFLTMLILQAIAMFFSFSGMSGSFGSGSGQFAINSSVISGSGVIAFSMFWVAIVAFMLTTERTRNSDFAFVASRLSSNLANISFLALASGLAGFTAALSGILLRNLTYFSYGVDQIIGNNFYLNPGELLTGLVATVLYMYIVSALGYLFGSLVQLFKPLVAILPGVLLGSLIMEARTGDKFVLQAVDYLIAEPSLPFFAVKALVVTALLFGLATLVTNKLEVRR